ncbi:unnamed protein product, partial [marine sediment metagenome]
QTEADIYLAIDNQSEKAQFFDLQFFFSKGDRLVASISSLERGVPYQIISTSTTSTIEKMGYRDEWQEEQLEPFSEITHASLLTTSQFPEKDKNGFQAEKKSKLFIDKDETIYLKAHIEFPPYIQDEFFIEVVGYDDGYGHLDPTILSDLLKEEWDNVTGWTDADTNGAASSIDPAGQLYLDMTGMSADGDAVRWQDIGSLSGDYWVEFEIKGSEGTPTVWDGKANDIIGVGILTVGDTYDLAAFLGNGATGGDGIWIYDGSSYVKVLAKTWSTSSDYVLKFHIHNSQTDVDIWVDNVKEVTDADMTYDSGQDDGKVFIRGYGSVAGNGEYHIDWLYIGTGEAAVKENNDNRIILISKRLSS